jgi:hypothetical protein
MLNTSPLVIHYYDRRESKNRESHLRTLGGHSQYGFQRINDKFHILLESDRALAFNGGGERGHIPEIYSFERQTCGLRIGKRMSLWGTSPLCQTC